MLGLKLNHVSKRVPRTATEKLTLVMSYPQQQQATVQRRRCHRLMVL